MTILNLDAALLKRFKNIKLLVLDVDGVMTDGGLTIGDDGQEYKTFHTHDGLGMKRRFSHYYWAHFQCG